MNLVITQSENTPETNLPAGIINKLYNLTFVTSNGVTSLRQDRPTNLVGTISLSGPTYQEYVTALTTQYTQFHVNASSYYVLFEDSVAQQVCATNWGDGTGVTSAQLAGVTNNNTFKNAFNSSVNTNIVKFNELQYFTNLSLSGEYMLSGWTSLQEVTLPNSCTSMVYGLFSGDTSLTTINNTTQFTSLSNDVFSGCSALQEIYLPSLTSIWCTRTKSSTELASIFGDCANLKKVTLGKITTFQRTDSGYSNYYQRTIYSCPQLRILDLGDQITAYGGYIFHNGSANVKAIIFRTATPPTLTVQNDNLTWGNSTSVVYVPEDPNTHDVPSAWQTATGFSTLYSAGRLKTIENDYNEATILAS